MLVQFLLRIFYHLPQPPTPRSKILPSRSKFFGKLPQNIFYSSSFHQKTCQNSSLASFSLSKIFLIAYFLQKYFFIFSWKKKFPSFIKKYSFQWHLLQCPVRIFLEIFFLLLSLPKIYPDFFGLHSKYLKKISSKSYFPKYFSFLTHSNKNEFNNIEPSMCFQTSFGNILIDFSFT